MVTLRQRNLLGRPTVARGNRGWTEGKLSVTVVAGVIARRRYLHSSLQTSHNATLTFYRKMQVWVKADLSAETEAPETRVADLSWPITVPRYDIVVTLTTWKFPNVAIQFTQGFGGKCTFDVSPVSWLVHQTIVFRTVAVNISMFNTYDKLG